MRVTFKNDEETKAFARLVLAGEMEQLRQTYLRDCEEFLKRNNELQKEANEEKERCDRLHEENDRLYVLLRDEEDARIRDVNALKDQLSSAQMEASQFKAARADRERLSLMLFARLMGAQNTNTDVLRDMVRANQLLGRDVLGIIFPISGEGAMVHRIKLIRDVMGFGLVEAKAFVEGKDLPVPVEQAT